MRVRAVGSNKILCFRVVTEIESGDMAESTDSSTTTMNAMEAEMKLLRRTVVNMNKTMQDMKENQEQTTKLLQDQTQSVKPPQEPARSVKSPPRQLMNKFLTLSLGWCESLP